MESVLMIKRLRGRRRSVDDRKLALSAQNKLAVGELALSAQDKLAVGEQANNLRRHGHAAGGWNEGDASRRWALGGRALVVGAAFGDGDWRFL